MFNTDKDTLSITDIEKYIEYFKAYYLPKLEKMKRYYDCKNDTIMNKTFKDKTKANNKCATPYCSYISNVLTGYFNLGGVTYTSQNETLINQINEIYKAQDEHTKNNQLALDASIYGVAYELLYIDEDKQVAFDTLDPRTIITIYDNTISQNLKFAIRYWTTKDVTNNEETTYIEVYSRDSIEYYTKRMSGTIKNNTEPHYFKKVPINIFRNTKGFTSDFGKLVPLVDSYDESISQTLNFREDLANSYLVFKNTNLTDEEILKMKEARVIQVEDASTDSQASVQYLSKDTLDAENENLKVRLSSDIEKFSYISELEVKSHTTASGNSLQLIGLEAIVQQKEYYAKKALYNRLTIIINYLQLLDLDKNCKATDINLTFKRNMPLDMSMQADIATKLQPIVSKETLLSQLPFITDVQLELERIKGESEVNAYADILQAEGE